MNCEPTMYERLTKIPIRRCPRCNSKRSYWNPDRRICYCERCGLQMDDITIIDSKLSSPLEFWYYPKTDENIDKWMILWNDLDPSSVPFGVDMLEFQRHFDAYKHPNLMELIMDPRLNKRIHEEWERKQGRQKSKNRWNGVYYSNALKQLDNNQYSRGALRSRKTLR